MKPKNSLLQLINNHLNNLDNSIQMTEKGGDSQSQILHLMEILKDQEIVDLLGSVHRSMI